MLAKILEALDFIANTFILDLRSIVALLKAIVLAQYLLNDLTVL